MIRKTPKSAKRTEINLAQVFASHQGELERAVGSVAHNPSTGAVHRTRVAARRLRALLGTFGDRERSLEIRRYRRDLRALALELAAVRQADVLREEMLDTLAKLSNGNVPARRRIGVLLDQEFFNASVFKGTIGNYLKQNGVGITKYVRIEVGQG